MPNKTKEPQKPVEENITISINVPPDINTILDEWHNAHKKSRRNPMNRADYVGYLLTNIIRESLTIVNERKFREEQETGEKNKDI
jgi:hypothetical protein